MSIRWDDQSVCVCDGCGKTETLPMQAEAHFSGATLLAPAGWFTGRRGKVDRYELVRVCSDNCRSDLEDEEATRDEATA